MRLRPNKRKWKVGSSLILWTLMRRNDKREKLLSAEKLFLKPKLNDLRCLMLQAIKIIFLI